MDLTTQEWRAIAPLPIAMQGFRVAALDDKIFAFGGFAYFGDTDLPVRSSTAIYCYEIDADRWEKVGDMPWGRSSNVLGHVGDSVFLIGGWTGWARPREDGRWESGGSKWFDTVDQISLQTLNLVESTALPLAPRRAFAAATLGDEITVVGGLGEHHELYADVATFNVKSKKWDSHPHLPLPRFSPGAAQLNVPVVVGGLYVPKTENEKPEFFSDVSVYDPHAGGGWHSIRKLSEYKSFPEPAFDGNKLYVFGGHGESLPIDTVEMFEIEHGA